MSNQTSEDKLRTILEEFGEIKYIRMLGAGRPIAEIFFKELNGAICAVDELDRTVSILLKRNYAITLSCIDD